MFQQTRPGAGFKTGDFVKEEVEGATVERVQYGGIAMFVLFR